MQTWLGKYRSPLPIRCRGAFHLYSAETLDAEPRVVLIAAHGAEQARRSLERARRALERSASPEIPRCAEHGTYAGVPFLALACEAIDIDSLLARFADRRPEHAEGAELIELMAQGRPNIEPRAPRPGALLVGPDATWMRSPTGERHRLGRRLALRRIVQRLVAVHPGPSLGVHELLEAGWPGERPIHEAGQNRVHVALSTLRKMGLRDVLQRHDGGYRLDPDLRVRRFDAAS